MAELTPEAVLQKLEAVRAETLRRLALLSQKQLDLKPPAKDGEDGGSLPTNEATGNVVKQKR